MIKAVSNALKMPAGGLTSAIALPAFVDGRVFMVGPFITVAHALPVTLAAGALSIDDDVRPHPHIGIAALTYLLAGEIEHRDALGNYSVLQAGDVGWMIAGAGVTHSERYGTVRAHGGAIESIQIWAALRDETSVPSYTFVAADDVSEIHGAGMTIREIGKPLAEALAEENVYLDHVLLTAGATITIGADAAERAVTVLSGSVDCGGTTLNQSQTAFFDPGATISITAITDARLLSFGGAPVGGRFMWWNFVASRMELIDAAKRKWRAAEFALPDGDAEAFTPCPEDGGRPLLKAAGYSL